jgi:hypothetical protein
MMGIRIGDAETRGAAEGDSMSGNGGIWVGKTIAVGDALISDPLIRGEAEGMRYTAVEEENNKKELGVRSGRGEIVKTENSTYSFALQ